MICPVLWKRLKKEERGGRRSRKIGRERGKENIRSERERKNKKKEREKEKEREREREREKERKREREKSSLH